MHQCLCRIQFIQNSELNSGFATADLEVVGASLNSYGLAVIQKKESRPTELEHRHPLDTSVARIN